ncbi:MAG: rhamnogalacturonan acetylesterase [Bacteroidales bacterium]|nr:rhamnogalacturonan acetylesterase [Bacteroidales bacterium]
MALLLSLLICLPLPSAVKVHTIGDSTMATYADNSPKIGWGQVLQQFFTNDVKIVNHALSGRSSKSFYQEKWSSVKSQIKEGDYVIIQFAHNDEKANGLDGDSLQAYYNKNGINKEANLRATSPNDTYKEYLRKYINETREKGGQPILVSSICRKYFSSDKKSIKRNGRHDLGDKFDKLTANGLTSGNKVSTSDHTYDYPYQMKLVAEEMGVPYLDMTTATAKLFIETGETTVTTWFAAKDDTHTNATGAKIMADLFVRLLREAGIMAEYIKLPSEETALPTIEAAQEETEYFDLQGRKVNPKTYQGILIDSKGQKTLIK